MIGDEYVNEDPRDASVTMRDKVAEIIWRQQSGYIPFVDGTHYRAADEVIALVGGEAWDEGAHSAGANHKPLRDAGIEPNPYRDTP